MAQVVDSTAIQNIVREEISPGIQESLPDIDGIFRTMKSTSMGVVRNTGIGRDYKVKHNFTASLAGAFFWKASPLGSTVNSNVSPPVMWDTLVAFPGADEATNMGTVQRELQLVQGTGNFFLPIQLFQVDTLDAATIKYVGENIRQVAKLVAHMNALSFYTVIPTNTFKPMARIESVTSGGTTGDATVTISLDGTTYLNGRIRNFYPGMLVDIFDTNASYASFIPSSNYAVVTTVDYLNKTVTIVTTAGGTWDTNNIAAGDYILAKDTGAPGGGTPVGYGPSGLETWIKSSGTVFGIALGTYPQFKSLVTAVSDSLTESTLNRYIGTFFDDLGMKLDTVITTGGVVRELLDQVEDLGQFQRQGAVVQWKGGWGDIGYQYNGHSFKWLLSSYSQPGSAYIVKTGSGNLKRYVPPRVPGTGTHKAFDGEVQFVAPWGGSKSIFKPLHNSSGATTELVEAPFITLHECAPTDIQSIKLTGLTELNG